MTDMAKVAICSKSAAEPVGPYSQAIIADSLIFVSGQLGMDLTKKKLSETVQGQTRLALESIGNILAEAGSTMDDVVKTTILLADMNDFRAVNQVYAEFFNEPFPARAAYQVVKLPLDAMVEIEAVARLKER